MADPKNTAAPAPEKMYEVTLTRGVKYGDQWLSPSPKFRIVLSGSAVAALGDAVAKAVEVK